MAGRPRNTWVRSIETGKHTHLRGKLRRWCKTQHCRKTQHNRTAHKMQVFLQKAKECNHQSRTQTNDSNQQTWCAYLQPVGSLLVSRTTDTSAYFCGPTGTLYPLTCAHTCKYSEQRCHAHINQSNNQSIKPKTKKQKNNQSIIQTSETPTKQPTNLQTREKDWT